MRPRVLKCLRPILVAARRTEQIAREVAGAQASLAPLAGLQHSLREQSKQEAVHADAFDRALRVLGEGSHPLPMLKALDELDACLRSDLESGNLPASMVGLQYVLEGLGSVALAPAPGELAEVGDQYVPIRELVLHQEVAHRRLGEVWIPRLAERLDDRGRERLIRAGREYAGLAEAIVNAGLPLLEQLGVDREHYSKASRAFIESLWRDPLTAPPILEATP